MNGYLVKRAMKSGRNWKKRYFVLDSDENTLCYYKKEGDSNIRGVIPISQDTTVRQSSIQRNAIEVKTPNIALYAYASTSEEQLLWVKAIQKVIDGVKGKTGNGTSATYNNKNSSSNNNNNKSSSNGSSAFNEMYSFAVSGTSFTVTKNYELIKPIGQGAYGVVVSALDKRTNKKVAIKKVTKAFEDLIDAKRILRELVLLRHFDHENVISCTDIIKPTNMRNFEDVYLISDLMETDLHRVIYSRQKLSDEHVQYFLYQLLRGLKYLHSANVIHRDLKPSNLLVNANCDLKICDFGLARGMDQESTADTADAGDMTEYVVTRWYRAPEIMLAVKQYGPAIDMWSAGCIFGELMSRKPLFPGNDYIHELKIICDVVGSPTEQELGFITSSKARRFMQGMRKKSKVPWSEVYPKYENKLAFKLIDDMCQFDPRKRITVEGALAHPYMESLHHPDDEPSCERPFEFKFDDTTELTKPRLQELMYQQALAFHP
jgi:serine/threonine protein kinase